MKNEQSYEERAGKFRDKLLKLIKLVKKQDKKLLQEYDDFVALFQEQETRHHREMYEAISGLLRRRPIPLPAVKTYVYLVACTARSQVKIGLSSNPERRMRTLSTANADSLELLHYVVGSHSLETALHDKFKQHRIRNEWYTRCPEIEAEFVKLSGKRKRKRKVS